MWLKQVLTWWDRIATIVPIDVPLDRVADARLRVLAEAGAVQAWPVEYEVRERAARAAMGLIDQGRLEAFPDGDPFHVHFGKMTDQLVEELKQRDLVLGLSEGNVLVPGKVGFLVMAVLAHVLGDRTRAWALTDQPDLATAYIGIARPPGAAGGAHQVVAADLRLTVPNLDSVDLARWLEFRDRHRAELRAYRRSIKQLARELSRARDPDEAEELLDDRREQVETEIEERRGLFRKLTSESVLVVLALVADVGTFIVNPAIGGALTVATGGLALNRLRHREVHHLAFLAKAGRRFG
jgi:hypothetical protein